MYKCMYGLHTVLYTYPKVLMRQICLITKSSLKLVIISVILMSLMYDMRVMF